MDLQMPPTVRICRDLMHAWKDMTVHRYGDEYEHHMTCSRCRTFKIQTLDQFGYIVKTSYSYSSDYIRKGVGRMTREERAELRKQSFRTVL